MQPPSMYNTLMLDNSQIGHNLTVGLPKGLQVQAFIGFKQKTTFIQRLQVKNFI